MNSGLPFECFGVPIEGTSLHETLARVREGRARWIVTANPEILLEAKRDEEYRNILKTANLRIADGIGLVWIAALSGHGLNRVTGVELAERLLDEAVKNNWSVAFVGGGDDVAKEAVEVQMKKRPMLHAIVFDGGHVDINGTGDEVNDETIQQLTMSSPDVILVAFGHPKQERWIAKQLPNLPGVKVAIGVGGTFDYWAGTVKRAPMWMRNRGLEWLFRLFIEPKRWKRILRAVFIFPFLWFFFRKT